MKKIVHDSTVAFAQRLDVLQAVHAPQVEIDAAIVVYERLRTAQAICQALVPGAYSETAMISLLEAICNEAALRTPVDEDEAD